MKFFTVTAQFILLLLLSSIALDAESSEQSHPFVVSGVIVNSGSAELIQRFTRYLAKNSDYPLHVVYVEKYSELSKILAEDPKAIGWTCGAPYVEDHLSFGQQLVAVPLFNQLPTYSSVVVALIERKETRLVDFKGGVLAFSDRRSNSGYLSPQFALFQQGITMENHFRLLVDAGNHEGSIEAVLNGLADVAAVDEYVWEVYKKSHPQVEKALHEIERMGPYPLTPIVTGNLVSPADIKKLSIALTQMNNSSEGNKLLAAFYFDGFVEKSPAFFDSIKHMLEKVENNSGK